MSCTSVECDVFQQLLAAAILACCSLASGRPNVVVLMADDLGYADVLGNSTLPTPNIDSIARRGATLTHHVAAAPVCTPSRAAFLTGRYPVRYGMESHGRNKVFLFVAASGGLPQSEITFPKVLQKNGYRTALIGKWHLGNDGTRRKDMEHHPLRHGFDYFYGLPLTNLKDFGPNGKSVVTTYFPPFYSSLVAIICVGASIAYYLRTRRFLMMIIVFSLCLLPSLLAAFVYNLPRLNGMVMRGSEVVEQPLRLPGLTQRLVAEAKDFLGNTTTQQPFLLVVNFVHVHTALFTAPQFANVSVKHGEYGDNVMELDWAVGEILKELEDIGAANNTLVYFSSDNGAHIEEVGPSGDRHGGCNLPFKGGKAMGGIEGGIRVPTAVMMPGVIPPGTIMNITTSQMDFFPTVLRAANLEAPPVDLDGRDMLEGLIGRQQTATHKALMHYCGVSLHAITLLPDDGNVYKVHYATPHWEPGTDHCPYVCHCLDGFVDYHEPPLVYNMTADPSEASPLPPNLAEPIILEADSARAAHQATLPDPPPISQFSTRNFLWKPWLQPCCNFPFCTCTDPRYP
ncbi:STS [Cordylochernes scorpioides]|uniref:STS n=1 Tax=Cordylochernes scorpioides TaxID=51811 RepID=A0ABY6LRQ5_9ARAC|nr:STS [Cordylochernes scorpioides]